MAHIMLSINDPHQLFSSSPTSEFDEHQWNLFDGLLACTETANLTDVSLPIFNALCPIIPPRELLLIANAAIQRTNNMDTRIRISLHIRDALNRTTRRRARLIDDYLSVVRKCIQMPLLQQFNPPIIDTGEDVGEDTATSSMFNMPTTSDARARLSVLHAATILTSLDRKPGARVKESQKEEERCCIRATVVNFACLTLEDYASMPVAPLSNGHGCYFPPYSSESSSLSSSPSPSPSPSPPRYGRENMINPPEDTVHQIALFVSHTCPTLVDLLEESHSTLPWVVGLGNIGSIKALANSSRTKQEIDDEKWANDTCHEMESSGEEDEDEDEDEDEEDDKNDDRMEGWNDESIATVPMWTICGRSHAYKLNIGKYTPSIVGVGVVARSLLLTKKLPSIIHPEYILSLCVPHLIAMISHGAIATSDKGVELFSLLLSHIPQRLMFGTTNDAANNNNSTSNMLPVPAVQWLAISQACIKFVVKCPDPQRRAHCWKTWSTMLRKFTLTHELALLKHLTAICPHNNVVSMLVDAVTRNCMMRTGPEVTRLQWTSELLWSVWDRAETDASDLYEVAEVYMSCMSTIRTCLMFEMTADVENVYGLWPSIGRGRKEKLETFRGLVHAKIEARSSDIQMMTSKIQERVKAGGVQMRQREEESVCNMQEETARLGIMEHMAGLVLELVRERNSGKC
jgi:hypothetical protein